MLLLAINCRRSGKVRAIRDYAPLSGYSGATPVVLSLAVRVTSFVRHLTAGASTKRRRSTPKELSPVPAPLTRYAEFMA